MTREINYFKSTENINFLKKKNDVFNIIQFKIDGIKSLEFLIILGNNQLPLMKIIFELDVFRYFFPSILMISINNIDGKMRSVIIAEAMDNIASQPKESVKLESEI